MLAEEALRTGYRVETFETLGSTNDEALCRARAGDGGKLWIVAGRQTQGRGRAGRPWSSPAGNLHATVLLVDICRARQAPELGFVAGLALVRAVTEFLGPESGVAIKWPNDLVRGGAKLAGILVEGTQLAAGGMAVAIGFGVNCAACPSDLAYPSISLSAIAGTPAKPQALLRILSGTLTETLRCWNAGSGFAAIRREWLGQALPSGTPLSVSTGTSRGSGVFKTIDGQGRLILDTPTGEMTVAAGDVFLASSDVPPVSAVQGGGNE